MPLWLAYWTGDMTHMIVGYAWVSRGCSGVRSEVFHGSRQIEETIVSARQNPS
jgi:hypothetical protein